MRRHNELALYIALQRINVARDRKIEDAQRGKRLMKKLSFLEAAKEEYCKLVDAVEQDAKNFIEKDIAGAHAHRKESFKNARGKVADLKTGVEGLVEFLDEFDQAMEGSNSGERPTSNGSSNSGGKLPTAGNIEAPVSSHPSENAHMAEVK